MYSIYPVQKNDSGAPRARGPTPSPLRLLTVEKHLIVAGEPSHRTFRFDSREVTPQKKTSIKEALISVTNLTYATLITSQRNLNPQESIQSPNPTPRITKMSLIIASLFSGVINYLYKFIYPSKIVQT